MNQQFQFRTADLLLAMGATGLWATVFLALDRSLVGPGTVAIALSGITIALHRVLRGRKHAWMLSALIAPIVAGACLIIAAMISSLD